MECDTAVLLWQPEVFDSKTSLPMQTVWGHVKNQMTLSSYPFLKTHRRVFIVCVCTEQTGLLYLCRAAEAGSSSSQRGPLTYPFWSHISSPPPSRFLPSESSGFLFSRSGAYRLFLHRCPPPSSPSLSQGMKGYFWGIDLVCPVQIPKDCGYLCLSVSENGGSM